MKRYQVTYVGNDSHEHSAVVMAKDHHQAISNAKKEHGADIVLRIERATNPFITFVKTVLWFGGIAAVIVLWIMSLSWE